MTATNWQSVAIRTSTFAVYMCVLVEAKQLTRLVFTQKNSAIKIMPKAKRKAGPPAAESAAGKDPTVSPPNEEDASSNGTHPRLHALLKD